MERAEFPENRIDQLLHLCIDLFINKVGIVIVMAVNWYFFIVSQGHDFVRHIYKKNTPVHMQRFVTSLDTHALFIHL
jgi:hypothetical protein